MMTRRRFLANVARGIAVAAAPVAGIKMLASAAGERKKAAVRWAFLVDTTKCVGCGLCVQACKLENEVPLEAHASRTWVERYVLTKDGKVFADTPNAGLNGYTTARIDLGDAAGQEIKAGDAREGVSVATAADGRKHEYQEIKPEDIRKAFFVPKLCNHCENPPCAQVCPVGATYQTPEGVVLVDRKTCIGCGYCIMACPYGARFFHPKYKVAEKCTFCYHRISKGMKPACVEACPFGARAIGNIKDPDDPVTQAVMTERVGVLKDEYGCHPQVYYIGLSKEVR
jgi:tetrathionate reductase subunit B